jgi:hypothetical protein
VHGGGLSFPRLDGWERDDSATVSWAYDVASQAQSTEPRWVAGFAVGALFTGDGFDSPRTASRLVMECWVTTGFYPSFTGRKDLGSKPVEVDGRPAWALRSEIRVDDPSVAAEGDVVQVIVVDHGSPESLAMFIGWVPIGDRERIAVLDRTIGDLRVEE